MRSTNKGFFDPCWIPIEDIGELTPERHAASIANEARALITSKYRRGQEEHGGELWRKPKLLDMAIEEALDQVIYLLTLRHQMDGEYQDMA